METETYKPKNIMVTGGCGFIGSHFVNKIVADHPDTLVVNVDSMYYCASEKNVTVRRFKNYKFVKCNTNTKEFISHLLDEFQIDTVVNFAAQSHVDNSFSNSLQYTYDNIQGTHVLLECCKQYGNIKRFIHVSTDEVYGECTDNVRMTETSVLCPTNPYSATKAGAELIAKSYYFSYDFPIIITRGNNVYGEWQYPEKLIPKFSMLLLENKKCTIHGQGGSLRSFIHVDDVVSAFETIMYKGKIGETYNIGSHDEYSVMDVTKKLVEIIKPGENFDDWIEYVKDRDFNDQRYHIDTSKLERLGWSQKIMFDEGLKRVIEWFQKTNVHDHWENFQ